MANMAMAEETSTVRLNFKNYEFEVTVDLETFNRINSDPVYKLDFARQTYESLENDGHFLGDDDNVVEEQDIKPCTFKWTKLAIDYLLKLRFSRNDDFNSPKTKKSELWQLLGKDLSRKFPGATGEICDAKYRNLLHTYKLNKQKEGRFGPDTVKWEYFEQFDQNLDLQLRIPSNETELYDSLFIPELDDQTGIIRKEDLIGMDSPPGSPVSTDLPKRKIIKDLRLTQYLKIRAENDNRRLRLKARIWKEKKQLKEREIAAILQLAKALKSKK